MLKEMFKMRKIGKHLVNVSMLSLAVVPIIVSGVQPVFAEERVSNAQTEYPTKIENDMTPSNTPDADGTYNSQIKSIELVSQSGNAYRYKVTLHDGYSIPENGFISLESNITEGTFSLDSNSILDVSGSKIGEIQSVSVVSKKGDDLQDALFGATSFSQYKELWKSMTSDNYARSRINFIIKSNDRFAKLNSNRSFEFVVNRTAGANRLVAGPQLTYEGSSRPKELDQFIDKGFKVGLGLNGKMVSGYKVFVSGFFRNALTRELKPFSYDPDNIWGYAVGKPTTSFPSVIENRVEFTATNRFVSHYNTLSAQNGSSPALYMKKGDVIRYKMPSGFRMNYVDGLTVGSSVNLGLRVSTPQYDEILGDRFSDTSLFKNVKLSGSLGTTTAFPATITKLTDDEIEFSVDSDLFIDPGTRISVDPMITPGVSDKGNVRALVKSIDVLKDLISLMTKAQLKEFAETSSNRYGVRYENTGLSLLRNGEVLSKSDPTIVSYFKNRNIAVGDQTNGTLKVKYVDEAGVEIPNNPIETISYNYSKRNQRI